MKKISNFHLNVKQFIQCKSKYTFDPLEIKIMDAPELQNECKYIPDPSSWKKALALRKGLEKTQKCLITDEICMS